MQQPQFNIPTAPFKDSFGNVLVACALRECNGSYLWRLFVAIEMTHDNADCAGMYEFRSSTELFAPGSTITGEQLRECMEQGNHIGDGQTEKQIFPHLFK